MARSTLEIIKLINKLESTKECIREKREEYGLSEYRVVELINSINKLEFTDDEETEEDVTEKDLYDYEYNAVGNVKKVYNVANANSSNNENNAEKNNDSAEEKEK